MYVKDFILVDGAFEEVAPRLVRDPVWMEPLMLGAITDSVSLVRGGPVATTTVRCARGAARHVGDALVITTRWAVTGPAFPALDADLTIAPLGPARAHLSFEGSYASGVISTDDDEEVRRLVELAVRAFLKSLAAILNS